MFKDRKEAGKQLAKELEHYRNTETLVLAIPRGGVPVAAEIASHLQTDLSVIIVRDLLFPYNPETAFGAVAEDGSILLLPYTITNLSQEFIDSSIEIQKKEIRRRIQILRKGHPLPNLENINVILVDDGINMGSSMRAAIRLCNKHHPKRIIVASPVASPEVARALDNKEIVNETVILKQPQFFRNVAQVYENWRDVPDHEVISILNDYHKAHSSTDKSLR